MKSALIGLSIAGIFLAATNPSQEEYTNYMIQNWQAHVCTRRSLSQTESLACGIAKVTPNSIKNTIVQSYSDRRNYVLFSVYHLNLGKVQHRVIGMGGQFFFT